MIKIEFFQSLVDLYSNRMPRDSQPYALTVSQNLNKANNGSFSKGIGEIIDDSFDANGNQFIASIRLTDKDEDILLFYDDGDNLPDMSVLRGLSDKLTGKTEEKIGLMNKGYIASECFFEPDRVINMSRDENNDPTVLQYNSGQHYKDIRESRENYADPKLVPHKYMSQGVLDLKVLPYLNGVFAKIRNPSLQKKLKGTLEVDASKGTSQFFMTLWIFKQGHKFYGTLDQQLKSCIRNFNFYHGLILKQGVRTISCEYADSSQELLDGITAQDLHAGSQKLRADCNVYVGNIEKEIVDDSGKKKKEVVEMVIMKITLSMDGFPESDTFWITNKPINGKYKETEPLYKEPAILREKKLQDFGSFVALLSILSDNEAHAQLKAFGGEFSDVNSLRGIFLAWNNRYLGKAWWDDDTWGASRNAGHVRAEIQICKNRALIQKFFNIQTDKSQMSCDDAHPVTKRFLTHLMANTIKTIFSTSKKTKEEKDNDDFKYEYAWNPTQMFHVIKHGELSPEVNAKRASAIKKAKPQTPPVQTPPVQTPPLQSAPLQSAPLQTAPLQTPPARIPSLQTPVVQALLQPVASVKPALNKEKPRAPSPEERPAPSKTVVGPHQRATPKSPRELLKEVMNFAEAIMNSNIQDIYETASNTTQKGLVEHVNALQAAENTLKTLGVNFHS